MLDMHFFGNTKQKMDAISDCVFRGEHPRAQMGSSLELFDIDNDGFDDVIVGARFARNWRGAVYIWWGAKDFNGNRPADAVLEGEPRSNMGADEIACGYFNNDHYGDILVGAPTYPGADTTRGRAYIFFGNRKSLFNTCRDITFEGEFGNCPQRFGIALSSGNLNGDKHDDVVFGAWGYKNNQGRAYLYYGPFSDTENISFNWDTTNASIGTHTLKVEIPPVPGEKNTEDNVKTITIDVKAPSL